MICKITDKRSDGGSSFKSLCSYMATGKKVVQKETTERVKYSGTRNLVSEKSDHRGIYEEMWLTSLKNTRVVDPVVHAIVSWPEGEEPTETQCQEAVEIYAVEHGLEENQCFWALHEDTDNFHLHICFNRVDIATHKAADLGLYKISNERAARKIEIAQGWQRQEGKFYAIVEQVNDQGEKILVVQDKMRSKKRRAISTKARDLEMQTGEKSAERVAQELAAPIIYKADTWATLHAQLAEQGIRLERKGSGGILWIGETPVKLSVAYSMKKLIARLGPFRPRELSVDIKKFKPQTLARDAAEEKSLAEYNKQRRDFYVEKRRAKAELNAWIVGRRASFTASKEERRQKMYGRGWKGRKNELQQARSLLAKEFAEEEIQLRAEIMERRNKYREQYARWAKYEEWLRKQQKEIEADLWRYRNAEAVIYGTVVIYKPIAVDKFQSELTGKVVSYKNLEGRTAFVDRGSLMTIDRWRDDDVIRAAIDVGMRKWGSFTVGGLGEFKQAVVGIAAESDNIIINNPDLAQRLKELRASRRAKEATDKVAAALRKVEKAQKEFDEYRDWLVQRDRDDDNAIIRYRKEIQELEASRPNVDKPLVEQIIKNMIASIHQAQIDLRRKETSLRGINGKLTALQDNLDRGLTKILSTVTAQHWTMTERYRIPKIKDEIKDLQDVIALTSVQRDMTELCGSGSYSLALSSWGQQKGKGSETLQRFMDKVEQKAQASAEVEMTVTALAMIDNQIADLTTQIKERDQARAKRHAQYDDKHTALEVVARHYIAASGRAYGDLAKDKQLPASVCRLADQAMRKEVAVAKALAEKQERERCEKIARSNYQAWAYLHKSSDLDEYPVQNEVYVGTVVCDDPKNNVLVLWTPNKGKYIKFAEYPQKPHNLDMTKRMALEWHKELGHWGMMHYDQYFARFMQQIAQFSSTTEKQRLYTQQQRYTKSHVNELPSM